MAAYHIGWGGFSMSDHPVFDAILARRSIRDFEDRSVEREKIEQLLKAAMAAPSACNLQPWAFIIVDEPEILVRVKDAAEQGKYNAPLAIVVCGINKHIPWTGSGRMQDCGAAVQNMLLAGTELGLSSVWIGGFDSDALSAALDIPDDVHPMCIIEFGYPTYKREPLTWYTDEAVHWQKYDSKKPRTLRTMQMLQDDIEAGIL
jgi:nitroreductase